MEYITQYQDVLNWIGFFTIGILLRKYKVLKKILDQRILIASGVVAVGSYTLAIIFNYYGYFNLLAIVRELSSIILLWWLCTKFAGSRCGYCLIHVGKYSFCIYLLHLPIVAPICSRMGTSNIACVARPFFGLAVMVVIIGVAKKITKIFPKLKWAEQVVGLR